MQVINFHIIEQCNYQCQYCFAKFGNNTILELDSAIKVIDNIIEYFKVNNIENGRINFAGGEPLLCPDLNHLIDYIAQKGFTSSIITNATLLTAEKLNLWQNKLSCIGISIDSIHSETNLQIGRVHNKETLELSKIYEIANNIHKCGIELKINIVVSKYNIHENFLPLFLKIKPNKVKFLQMHIVKNIKNDAVKEWEVSTKEFLEFCSHYNEKLNRLLPKTKIVIEEQGSMENSYIMIDPSGNLLLNNNGVYQQYGNLTTTSLTELYSLLPLHKEKITKRYAY